MTLQLIIAALLLAACTTGCTSGDGNYFNEPDAGEVDRPDFAGRPAVFDIRVEPAVIEVGYDETFVVDPIAYERNGDVIEDVTFTLEYDTSVIDPQIDNRYRAISVGETEFRASVDGIDGFARIEVGAQRVGSFDIRVGDRTLGLGESTSVDVDPLSVLGGEYQTPELLEFDVSSSNPEVADFDESGRLVAAAVGTTDIVAEGQGVRSNLPVEVFEYEIDSITLNSPRDPVVPGETSRLNWRVVWRTEQPNQFFVSFTSSNPDVASVQGGEFIAKSAGTATLTASVAGYEPEGTFELEVVDRIDTFAMLESSRILAITIGTLVGEEPGGFRYINQLRDQYKAIDAGDRHACLIRSDDLVSCWGASDVGQTGYNMELQVPRPLLLGDTPSEIRVDGNRSCALIGMGWLCWGDLDGTSQTTPTPVNYTAFGMSEEHWCELDLGVVNCSGINTAGQIGQGDFSPTASGPVSSPETFVDVVVGPDFSCARTSTDTYCWGEGDEGQLGSLPFDDAATPRRVDTPQTFTAIETGTAHACGLTASGDVYCWGRNDAGQVGDGSFQTRPTPTRIDSPETFVRIGAGGDRSCGLTTNGALFCWGANPTGNASFPVRVPLRLTQLF